MTRLQIQKMTEAIKRRTKAHNERIKALDAYERAKVDHSRAFQLLAEKFKKHGLKGF